jgi:exonuclease III
MSKQLRVVTWNCRRALASSEVWDYLLEQSPAVVLLQEVGAIPDKVHARFQCHRQAAVGKTGRPQRFDTALLVRGRIGDAISLKGVAGWVDAELDRFAGNLICRELFPVDGPPLKAVSVYSPAWPIDPKRLTDVDVSDVRLTQNPGLWLADILWASLKHHNPSPTDGWIVAGDFNLSETFDQASWSSGGNREFLDRMSGLGLVECLRKSKGALTPTFRNADGGAIRHQIDHMFVTSGLARRLIKCETGAPEKIFAAGLSDHLPIVADFSPVEAPPPDVMTA